MSFSYDPLLSTDVDWVRFLTGDRTEATLTLSDEEILGLLRETTNKYYAAAAALRISMQKGGGRLSKSVEDLSITYDVDGPREAMLKHIERLEIKGAEESMPKNTSRVFRVL